MAWNIGKSILGTGDMSVDVEREADVIFTAAFVGATLFQNDREGGRAWRVDMEPNSDIDKNLDARTADDRASMQGLNDACSKVNQLVRTQLAKDEGGVVWGLTPTFDRGGMIQAGGGARSEYAKVNPAYAKTAFSYLTAAQRAAKDGQRADEMYIGRGAYCGLVVDDEGNAVTAMSTIRTTLNENTPDIGERWRPPADADVRAAQYPRDKDSATWGLIGGVALQTILAQQGMRFYPQSGGVPVPPDGDTDIVGYTHGMIRCIYETVRIGQGTAFEMSIGVDTFKLASCMSCSSFMMANGVDASSTHLGRGESWSPYYSSESHNPSYHVDKMSIDDAIRHCNSRYSAFMHQCLRNGVAAMTNQPSWVSEKHGAALARLDLMLVQKSTAQNSVARDLFLDAMTYHKSDLQRLNGALVYGSAARPSCDARYDWSQNRSTGHDTKGTWETWVNPHSDEEVRALHTSPDPLVKP
ncbi:hypothetical protein [Variovorax sp. J22R115]|uniref:hypothetical protein n=1 Tax=Variovorax sp. J22R115 TaxID=3053509 RepID=UPI0025754E59|nr:hypothetical protein [Variovorax sp. J22R115]MDM0053017.1 hypothetical protein [Variovorax sp. J22R115]